MSSRSRSSGFFSSPKVRFNIIRFGVFFAFIVVFSRLVYVQAIMRRDLQAKAERQFSETKTLKGIRHRILDREGRTLAETVKVKSCFIDPQMVDRPREVAALLSREFGLSKSGLEKEIRQSRSRFRWIKRNIPADQVERIEKQKLSGIGFKDEMRRHYPMGAIASHVLGLVGIEGTGLSGVEMVYEKSLNITKQKKNNDGDFPAGDIQLTIDGEIQQIVERELSWGAEKIDAKSGMVVVANPQSGEIFAVASWPPLSLDPDNPPDSLELRIPAVVDVFEPGSTFKIVTAAAALEEDLIEDNETFDGEKGAWRVADITIHDHKPIEKMKFEDIWIHSSNIGSAKIADRLGTAGLYQYARLFGFGVFPGCGLSGEAKGTLRPPSEWSGVSKNVISFGQEVGVTALQMVGAYSTIANGGRLMEPKIIRAILDEDGKPLWHDSPVEVRRVLSESTANRIRDILVKVVERGTGQHAQVSWAKQYKMAGKTGTAQKFDKELGRYRNDLSLVSFCGFFPASQPKYTITVFLDESHGSRWGGLDAAPIARRIAEQLISDTGKI